MAIIQNIKKYSSTMQAVGAMPYPDQMVSDKEKRGDDWIKSNLDYFYTVAINQYQRHTGAGSEGWVRNYELVKGILCREDFYEDPGVKSFTDTLVKDLDLPKYVKHYSILNPPLNTMVGEMTKRPDNARVKACDPESQAEEMQYRTEMLMQLIFQKAQAKMQEQLSTRGVDIFSEEGEQQVNQLTEEKVKEYMNSYTSTAERWASETLDCLKREFNIKELSEEGFRDLLISCREYYHIFEDKSKTGFGVEVCNPKNVWLLTTPDKKYTRDAYAAGIIEVMELSEILNKFDLTKEEIDHLRKAQQEAHPYLDARESNLVNPRAVGPNSVTYDTYNQAVVEERMRVEADLKAGKDELGNFLGINNTVGTFGEKFAVVRAYWCSKKKIGKLTYYDEEGIEQVELVDETYKAGSMPGEIDLEWGYINQWYQGVKIGADIYYAEPLSILDHCPIIGVIHENKNTEARSLVDLMKPFQMIYNVCMNQLWRLLEKEIGKTYRIQLKKIPTPKDGDNEDALDQWMNYAMENGIIFEDESIENTKVPIGNTAVSGMVDLSRSDEIQTRYNLAAQIKAECWELVGLSRQRLGSTVSSETATAINTALTQSYAQTETYFVQHEYVLNQVYQAMIDAAQYVESAKPQTTLSYINDEGMSAFLQINGNDLKLRDLKVFVTSRAEDQRIFNEVRMLSQAMLQNGASPYEIAVLYSTNSVATMKNIFKSMKDKQDAFVQQQQQAEQQAQQQQAQIAQMQTEAQMKIHEDNLMMKKYEIDTRANTELTKAQIANYFQDANADVNQNSIPDPAEIAAQGMKQQELIQKRDLESMKLDANRNKATQDQKFKDKQLKIKEEELKIKREDIASKERIAKANKNKYDK